jgi:hypothetical protein
MFNFPKDEDLNLRLQIVKICIPDLYDFQENYVVVKFRKLKDGFEVHISKMYLDHIIGLNLDRLMQLAELFGTTSIDVDNYSDSGCETCDYGSAYGYDLQIRKATKNIPVHYE